MKNSNWKTKLRGGIKRALCFMLCVVMLSLCVDGTASAKEKKMKHYEYMGGFSEGLAWVMSGDKCGYIDKTGKEVVKLKYDGAGNFSDGLALVDLDFLKWGYIDKTGKVVLEDQK